MRKLSVILAAGVGKFYDLPISRLLMCFYLYCLESMSRFVALDSLDYKGLACIICTFGCCLLRRPPLTDKVRSICHYSDTYFLSALMGDVMSGCNG